MNTDNPTQVYRYFKEYTRLAPARLTISQYSRLSFSFAAAGELAGMEKQSLSF